MGSTRKTQANSLGLGKECPKVSLEIVPRCPHMDPLKLHRLKYSSIKKPSVALFDRGGGHGSRWTARPNTKIDHFESSSKYKKAMKPLQPFTTRVIFLFEALFLFGLESASEDESAS